MNQAERAPSTLRQAQGPQGSGSDPSTGSGAARLSNREAGGGVVVRDGGGAIKQSVKKPVRQIIRMCIIQLRVIYSFLRKTSMIVPSGMASIYRRMLTFDGGSFGERTKRGLFISFGAKETNQRKHSPHQGLPSRGGCNRSSCRSYTNVSSTHQRVGMFLSTTLDAGRYGCGSSIVLIIYAIVKTPGV